MKNEYINLTRGKNGNMLCKKCKGEKFAFDGSINFDDHHLTQYKCDKCGSICGVTTPKDDEINGG